MQGIPDTRQGIFDNAIDARDQREDVPVQLSATVAISVTKDDGKTSVPYS